MGKSRIRNGHGILENLNLSEGIHRRGASAQVNYTFL